MSVQLAVGETQQLTATLFDALDNVLTGRVITWSSSDPAIATVSGSGLVTAVAEGACTITASCEGKTGTTSIDAVGLLPFLLDFAPAFRVSDIVAPRIFQPGENPTGKPLGVPIWDGAQNRFRHAYPGGDGKWYQVIPRLDIFAQGSTSGGGRNGAVVTPNVGAGSWPASHVDEVLFPNGATNCDTQLTASSDLQAGDSQDANDYKRSYVVALKAKVAGSIGRLVRKILESRTLFTILEDKAVAVTADWTAYSDDFASDAERTDSVSHYYLRSHNDAGDTDALVAGGWVMPHRTRPRPEENLSPGLWHPVWGMFGENPTQNCCVPSDAPVVINGSVAPSPVPRPDADDKHSAPTYQRVTMFTHASILTDTGYSKCVQQDAADLHDVAPAFIFVGHKHKPLPGDTPPADGVFQGYVEESTGVLYGPVAMNSSDYCPKPLWDADGGRFYWTRLPVNTPHVNIVTATVNAGNLDVVTDNTHGLNVGDPVCLVGIKGVTGGTNPNGIFTVAAAPDNLHFTINGVAPTGGPFTTGQARHGYTMFRRQVRNEGPDLTFDHARGATIAEGFVDDRNTGWPDALVPRETITAPQTADPAWPVLWDPSLCMTRTEGWFLIHLMWPFPVGDMLRLGIGKRDFFQGGPAGGGNVFLQGGVLPGLHDPTKINIKFSSAWPSDPTLQGWTAECDITAGSDRFPRFCPFVLALGWKPDPADSITKLYHLGIGMGPGTGITWYENGSPFFGGTWSIQATAGTPWDYSTFPADKHLGLLSDLDITGLIGWLQAVGCGGPVPVVGSALPANFRARVEHHLQRVWPARVDYMAA